MVKQHFENTVQQLKADRERQIAIVKDRVTREIIVPHHSEINMSRDKAIQELNAKLQDDIRKLQEKFAIDKKALIDVGEKNKLDFAESAIASETAIFCAQYDKAIADIEALISKLKE